MTKLDNIKRRKILQAINFIEELSWLFSNHSKIDTKEVPFLLRNLLESNDDSSITSKYSSTNKNKNFLIGILPNLFQDSDLFKSNLDLSDFGSSALKITITRPEKRSRYELIGLIICKIAALNDSELLLIVNALSQIAGDEEKMKQLEEAKKDINFSWNETIQNLNF